MSAEKIIKQQAREKLKEYGYVKPLFAGAMILIFFMLFQLIVSLFVYAIEFFTLVTKIDKTLIESLTSTPLLMVMFLSALLLSPVVLGYFKMISNDNGDYDIADVLYFFKDAQRYRKAVIFVFAFVLRMVLPIILFSIPTLAMTALGESIKGLSDDFVFIIAKVLLTVCTYIAIFAYSVKYFLAFRLFCENQDNKTSNYFYVSKTLMTGHGMNICKLLFSFTPWILLCITVLPVLYVFPYITQAMNISGKWIFEISRNGQSYEIL